MAHSNSKGESLDRDENGKIWKIWRLHLTDRVKTVAWKVFHHALPVSSNSKRRGCEEGRGCCFCGYYDEI